MIFKWFFNFCYLLIEQRIWIWKLVHLGIILWLCVLKSLHNLVSIEWLYGWRRLLFCYTLLICWSYYVGWLQLLNLLILLAGLLHLRNSIASLLLFILVDHLWKEILEHFLFGVIILLKYANMAALIHSIMNRQIVIIA